MSKLFFEYFNMILFVAAIACMLAGMVLGPFGYDNMSIVFSGCACVLLLLGILVTLRLWKSK